MACRNSRFSGSHVICPGMVTVTVAGGLFYSRNILKLALVSALCPSWRPGFGHCYALASIMAQAMDRQHPSPENAAAGKERALLGITFAFGLPSPGVHHAFTMAVKHARVLAMSAHNGGRIFPVILTATP